MTMIIDGTNGLTFNNATTQASAGNVLQVVNVTYGVETTTTSGTYVDTGLTATITPKFSTSKVLIIVNHADCGKFSVNTGVQIKLLRGSTSIFQFSELGGYTNDTSLNVIGSIGGNYLDSPATTSATTYKTQFASQSGGNGVRIQYNSGVSSITLMEIAG